MAEQQKKAQEQDLNQLLKVRREKLTELQENGKDPFQITKYDVTHHSMEVKDAFEELEGKSVSLAGRMMSKRIMGKASFADLSDRYGRLQMYIKNSMSRNRMLSIIKKAGIIGIWLVIWQIASSVTGLAFLLPGPVTVFLALGKALCTRAFYRVVFHSFIKISAGFLAALLAGLVLGSIAAVKKGVQSFLEPLVLLMRALPVAAFIIVMLIWFGSQNAAVTIGFMVVFPMVYQAVLEGVCAADTKLLEMAAVFELSPVKKVRYIYVPQIMPFLNAAVKTAAGMCWKAGVSAEVIGLVKNSIGEELYYAKLYLMMPELFAWSITIMCISFLFEKLAVALIRQCGRVISGDIHGSGKEQDRCRS